MTASGKPQPRSEVAKLAYYRPDMPELSASSRAIIEKFLSERLRKYKCSVNFVGEGSYQGAGYAWLTSSLMAHAEQIRPACSHGIGWRHQGHPTPRRITPPSQLPDSTHRPRGYRVLHHQRNDLGINLCSKLTQSCSCLRLTLLFQVAPALLLKSGNYPAVW